MAKKRCEWAEGSDTLMLAYHDEEWGTPSRDDRHLFEMLTLEGAQAGLSWQTILNKREGYRRAFAGFDPARVARFDARTVERLMQYAGIVRNRAKIESTVSNAKAVLGVRRELGSLARYLWSLVGGEPIRNRWRRLSDLPAETEESKAMSKDLKERGFRFVGPTTCYAFMQAVAYSKPRTHGRTPPGTVTDGVRGPTSSCGVRGAWVRVSQPSSARDPGPSRRARLATAQPSPCRPPGTARATSGLGGPWRRAPRQRARRRFPCVSSPAERRASSSSPPDQ